ncbi:MAG: hypothetical protein GY705_25810, partial [Bacteroidetes bacterium]|nr:hypothetical protein [Bacteroidota bacterium]
GGLIQDEDRSTTRKIPLAGDIPVVGRLFSSKYTEVAKTDILMSITPVIIRHPDVPKQDITGFWSGTQKDASIKEPEEEKIKKESGYNDIPNKDYVKAMANDEFLPSDNYFSIQVYSSKDKKDAESRSEEIKKHGYKTWIRQKKIKDKGRYYRVFAEQFTSYYLAEQTRLNMLKTDIFPKDIHIVDRDYVYK